MYIHKHAIQISHEGQKSIIMRTSHSEPTQCAITKGNSGCGSSAHNAQWVC